MSKKRNATSDVLNRNLDGDIPEWTDDVCDMAAVYDGETLLKPATGVLKRGRPKLENPKERVTMRLDADLLRKLRGEGEGWQTRANALLRTAVGM